jgi:hypothetical protein
MKCPPEVARVLMSILRAGLLRIRIMGWGAKASRCAVEADHLHNLPDLLCDFSAERLLYYWEAERAEFLRQSTEEDGTPFRPFWDQLEPLVERLCSRNGSSRA